MRITSSLTILLSIAGLVFVVAGEQSPPGLAQAQAQDRTSQARCYPFQMPNHPLSAHQDRDLTARQTWCYVNLPENGERLVYRGDLPEAQPEQTALLHSDGSITFGSRVRGRISYHRIPKGYNPLPVPLEEPISMQSLLSESHHERQRSAINLLREYPQTSESLGTFAVDEGVSVASVPESNFPWRSYWFPYTSGRMHRGGDKSPIGKYDKFIEARTLAKSEAHKWERWYHNGTSNWYGHCNGWAAASILEKEPKVARQDPRTLTRFDVGDQKALLIEKNMCVSFKLFGRRFEEGQPESMLWDMNPDLLHKALIANIGFIKKPILVDYDRGVPVFNAVVTGYKMSIRKIGNRTFDVVAELETHNFDNEISDKVGAAPLKKRVYKYILHTDDSGYITSGSWRSGNPDFVWIPIAIEKCPGSNPHVANDMIDEIINGLPEAPPLPTPRPSPTPQPPTSRPTR